ncbi:hypothetical protein FA13DRAFT_1797302 [Coprinellus micaceus]|uniref:C2H2-type domain-containing protein n=1 Tax=Coprinellus micaceus TaxID=71717 RepID=A0A4Y7SRE8_COPMI|nr:hypothetical protein FA13DRAFT_1797302 [Coprinellus micaceus]
MSASHAFACEYPVSVFHNCPHCGKVYSTLRHLEAHERSSCTVARQDLSSLLQQTKAFWESKKRKIIELSEQSDLVSPQLGEGGGTTGLHCTSSGPGPSKQGGEGEIEMPRRKRQRIAPPSEPIDVPRSELEAPVAVRKAKREKRVPARYTHDPLPGPPPQVLPILSIANDQPIDFQRLETQIALLSAPTTIPSRRGSMEPLIIHESKPSPFGIIRRYALSPGVELKHNPDQAATYHNKQGGNDVKASYGPFTSQTAFLLAEWYWTSTKKSFHDFQKLISLLNAPEFSLADATDVNWRSAFKVLGANKSDLGNEDASWITDDGWLTATVSIDIPFHKKMKQPGTKTFVVGDFRYRSIVSIIKEKLSSRNASREFHYYPYEATWKRTPDSPEVQLYGELYMSREFREVHEQVQRLPPTYHNEKMERVVVALMIWSDGTQLTSFGGASLWPCYLFFGNESKCQRGKPSQQLGHQIAYFMKLPDHLNDYLKEVNGGKLPSDSLFTYCRRELFHKQWSILLSQDLVDAMKHGIIITCPDNIERCFFPRIFTYSADYPEKGVFYCFTIAGLRTNGLTPCHRCLVQKDQLFRLGAPSDTERVHQQRSLEDQQEKVAAAQVNIVKGYAVDSKDVIEKKLVPTSLVPLNTAFDGALSGLDFNILSALAVDILHEFENRGMEAAVPAFDATPSCLFHRYEQHIIGSRTRFSCSIPSFESLLPGDHNARLMSLLFVCAQWHALAKLKLHNDYTLRLLDYTTTQLGALMRRFDRDTCTPTPTKELAKEADARAKKEGAKGQKGSASQQPKSLGMYTIKFHFLGDYTSIIRRLGTTDSYSTQTGELYDREPKSWYPRTDRKDYEAQLSRIERRKARLARIRSAMDESQRSTPTLKAGDPPATGVPLVKPTLQDTPLDAHYIIGQNQNQSISLDFFTNRFEAGPIDEYLVDFIPSLKKHLALRFFERVVGRQPPRATEDLWPHIVLQNNSIYSHKLLRINYTTYDVRRDQDVLHVDTPQCNVMLLNSRYNEKTWLSEHPYLYGRLLGVFHANVRYNGSLLNRVQQLEYLRIDFAWIHWYQFNGSDGEFSLDRVTPSPLRCGSALDFIDPSDIIRSVHLIPRFSAGKVNQPVVESQLVRNRDTWESYFINKFADRDLFMRYQYGMSIGHLYMHTAKFPPPHVPTIPSGFDHCEILQAAPLEAPPATPGNMGPAEMAAGQEPNSKDDDMVDTAAAFGDHCDEGGEMDDEKGEDVVDQDDLDDDEFLAYNDMYGEPGDEGDLLV